MSKIDRQGILVTVNNIMTQVGLAERPETSTHIFIAAAVQGATRLLGN